jgi:hypothetical protein
LVGFSAVSDAFGQSKRPALGATRKSQAGASFPRRANGTSVQLPRANEEGGVADVIEFTEHGLMHRRVPVTIKAQQDQVTPPLTSAAVSGGCPSTITHSLNQSIVANNSTACFDDKTGFTRENTYWRAFDMNTFTGGQAYDISSITFGVQQSTAGNGFAQDLDVVLYVNNGAPFPGGTLEPLAGAIFSLALFDESLFIVQIPLNATTVPAGTSEVVMEVFSPDGVENGNLFVIGSNAEGQTGPSYVSWPDCGFPDPVDLTSIGFPDMHIVFNINGSCQGGSPTPGVTPRPRPIPHPRPTPRP